MALVVAGRPAYPSRLEDRYSQRLLRRVTAARNLLDDHLVAQLRKLAPEIDELARVERAQKEADRAAGRVDALDEDLVDDVPDTLAEAERTTRLAVGLAALGARRVDGKGSVIATLLRVVEQVRRVFAVAYEPNEEGLTDAAGQVALFALRQQERSFPGLFAITVGRTPAEQRAISQWARDNADLIRTIDSRYFDDVARVIREAVERGTSTREIERLLRDRYSVSKSRARTIARDQIGKLNGRITQAKHESVGVDRYVWLDSRDERVRGNPGGRYPSARPSHWARHGKLFEWAKPPEGGHPGEAILCRCVARPYFDD